MVLDNVEDCREQAAYVGRDLSGTGARTLDNLHRAYMENLYEFASCMGDDHSGDQEKE